MAYKLTKWEQSNYNIEITFSEADKAHEKEHVLRHFQADMDLKWFRKGHAPMDLVEKNVQPAYLEMAIVEHIANHAIQDVLKENENIKFIGEPYWFEQKKDWENNVVMIKLDVYPEITVKSDSWKKESVKKMDLKVEEKEIDDTIANLRKNFADYQDAEKIELWTVSKIALEWLDKDWNSLDKGTTYLWEAEFNENKFWEKTFIGKAKDEEFELKYNEKDLPEVLHTKKEWEVKVLKLIVKDIKKQILPEFTPENIEKYFGKEAEFKNEDELRVYIKKTLIEQKEQSDLIKVVDEYISKLRNDYFDITIPQTMIQQEFQSRIHSLEQRMWSKEKMEEYFKNMTDEKKQQFVSDIQWASQDSLWKFFVLQKVAELLWIELSWDNQTAELVNEKRLYEYFNK